jgi:hypothetical protein
MRALVLTYDRCRPITEHMLKTYSAFWPGNPFVFRIPYQENHQLNAYGQRFEFVRCGRSVFETMATLFGDLSDEDWVYWCMDDKFLLNIDQEAASYFAGWLHEGSRLPIDGLSFCRARHLWHYPTVSATPVATTPRGDPLLRRFNYNNIWLHQFLRIRALRSLFEIFPQNIQIRDMDILTRQGTYAVKVPEVQIMYVTEKNFVAFGESTVAGKITQGCLSSMRRLCIQKPYNFETENVEIVIGSLGHVSGE